jgi:hypothetical protein
MRTTTLIPTPVHGIHELSTRCHRALHQALAAYRPTATFDEHGYVTDVHDNFLYGIELEDIRSDFEAGAGRELKGKMRAPHSSSALAVNTFGRWSGEPSSLCICGHTGFKSLKFEQQCPTGLGGTAPHLDVLAVAPKAVVAVESKCLEHLHLKHVDFSPSYLTITDARAGSPFFKLALHPREIRYEFKRLDAAQLVKHYFGLSKCWPDKRITLLYAYWEPQNANDFNEFVEHRREVEEFRDLVSAESNFTLRAVCYRELWDDWGNADTPVWLRDHVRALRKRYDVTV